MTLRALPRSALLSLALCAAAAADRLPGNFLSGAAAAGDDSASAGKVWVWTGDEGAALVELAAEGGRVRAESISASPAAETFAGIPWYPRQFLDWRLSGAPSAVSGNHLLLPAYEAASGSPKFAGFLRFDRRKPEDAPALLKLETGDDDAETGEGLAVRTMAVARKKTAATDSGWVWLSLGSRGIGVLKGAASGSWSFSQYAIRKTGSAAAWETGAKCDAETPCDFAESVPVHAVRVDSSGRIWAETAEEGNGRTELYEVRGSGTMVPEDDGLPLPDGRHRAGAWSCGGVSWAQTARKKGETLSTALWRRGPGEGAWTRADSARWDTLAVFAADAECLGGTLWGAAHSFDVYRDGLLKMDAEGVAPFKIRGAAVPFSDVAVVPDGKGGFFLAAATWGSGLAASADSGKSWSLVMNRTEVKGDLKEIRCIPSLLASNSASSKIAYRLGKKSKVTIEVFSYDMRKIRTVVRGAVRFADQVRSSDADEDVWDGRDDEGRSVSSGVYYVRVKDDRGHEGWGKIYKTAGPR